MKPTSNQTRLTTAAIQAAGDGDHFDATVAGLIVRVRGRAASWVFRYSAPSRKRLTAAGKAVAVRREYGLGSAARHSAETAEAAAQVARAKALQLASAVMLGRDPLEEKQAAQETAVAAAIARARRETKQRRTLGACIWTYHELEVEGAGAFTPKYCAQWIAAFENHLRPYEGGALWNKPIDAIEAHELLDFFKALQRRVPHTARKARQRLDSAFEYAVLKKWCDANPTKAIVRAVRRGAASLKN